MAYYCRYGHFSPGREPMSRTDIQAAGVAAVILLVLAGALLAIPRIAEPNTVSASCYPANRMCNMLAYAEHRNINTPR